MYPFEPIKDAQTSVEFAWIVESHKSNSNIKNGSIFVGDCVGNKVGDLVVGAKVVGGVGIIVGETVVGVTVVGVAVVGDDVSALDFQTVKL